LEYPVHPWQRLHSASQSCGRLLIDLELAITSMRMEIQRTPFVGTPNGNNYGFDLLGQYPKNAAAQHG
jgi:hypothetical protein